MTEAWCLRVVSARGRGRRVYKVCTDDLRACLCRQDSALHVAAGGAFTKCALMTCVRVFAGRTRLCTWPGGGFATAKGVRCARLATSRDALARTAWGPRTILPYAGRLAGHIRREVGVCALRGVGFRAGWSCRRIFCNAVTPGGFEACNTKGPSVKPVLGM